MAEYYLPIIRDVATRGMGGEGAQGPWSLFFNYRTNKVQAFQFQTSGILLFTNVQKLHGPEISQFLPCMLQFLDNLGALPFFLSTQGNRSVHVRSSEKVRYLTLDRPILNPGPSERFLFVDHPKENPNEREFEPQIINEISDLPKTSCKTREASIIYGPQLNIIASILKLLKKFSEVIVASNCGQLARIEKQAMS